MVRQFASPLQLVIGDHDAIAQQRIQRCGFPVVFRLIPEVERHQRLTLGHRHLGAGGQTEAVARGARGEGVLPGGLRQVRVRGRGHQPHERVGIPGRIPTLTPQIDEVWPPVDRTGMTQVGRDLELAKGVLPGGVDPDPDRVVARLSMATPQFFAINLGDHVVHRDPPGLELTGSEDAADLQSVIGEFARGLLHRPLQADRHRGGTPSIIRVRQQLPEAALAVGGCQSSGSWPMALPLIESMSETKTMIATQRLVEPSGHEDEIGSSRTLLARNRQYPSSHVAFPAMIPTLLVTPSNP